MTPDPKPAKRVRDPQLLRRLHLEWRECVLADETCERQRSLHHVSKHPRDDLRENLVMVCGSGTTGHHGKLEEHDMGTEIALAVYIAGNRPDMQAYLTARRPDLVERMRVMVEVGA